MNLILRLTWLQRVLLGAFVFIVTGFTGSVSCYASGVKEREKNLAISIVRDTEVHFDLGMDDFEALISDRSISGHAEEKALVHSH